jgi:hypothetical protein
MNRFFSSLLILYVLIALLSCSKHKSDSFDFKRSQAALPKADHCKIDAEEYEIHSTVLNYLSQDKTVERFIVSDTTVRFSNDEPDEYYEAKLPILTIAASTFPDFTAKNASVCRLGNQFHSRLPVTLATEQDLSEIFSQRAASPGWPKFYKKFPRSYGLLTFYRPGFNTERTRATLPVNWSCGGFCGRGNVYFLEKAGDEWRVKYVQETRLS